VKKSLTIILIVSIAGSLFAQEKLYVEQVTEVRSYANLEGGVAAVEFYSYLNFYEGIQPISEFRFLIIAGHVDLAIQVRNSNNAIQRHRRLWGPITLGSLALGVIVSTVGFLEYMNLPYDADTTRSEITMVAGLGIMGGISLPAGLIYDFGEPERVGLSYRQAQTIAEEYNATLEN
jgi:hypothetical protein